MEYRPPISCQEVSNTNHFGSVSDNLGQLVAASECMASIYIFTYTTSGPRGPKQVPLAPIDTMYFMSLTFVQQHHLTSCSGIPVNTDV